MVRLLATRYVLIAAARLGRMSNAASMLYFFFLTVLDAANVDICTSAPREPQCPRTFVTRLVLYFRSKAPQRFPCLVLSTYLHFIRTIIGTQLTPARINAVQLAVQLNKWTPHVFWFLQVRFPQTK